MDFANYYITLGNIILSLFAQIFGHYDLCVSSLTEMLTLLGLSHD